MFDSLKHKNILIGILKDIYSDTSIAPYLGFKGGTAALLFYGLSRDSVDLDFDLLDESQEGFVFEKIQEIAKQYGTILEARVKRFNLIAIISYDRSSQNAKIEINRRLFGSRYEMQTLLGISMLVMVKEDMFAHKLLAMVERIGKTSRDIFDVYFFAKDQWAINKKIVEQRAGKPYREVLAACISLVEKKDNKHILDGLGELLTQSQKDWARAKLKSETLFLLRLALENEQSLMRSKK